MAKSQSLVFYFHTSDIVSMNNGNISLSQVEAGLRTSSQIKSAGNTVLSYSVAPSKTGLNQLGIKYVDIYFIKADGTKLYGGRKFT